MPTTTDRQKRTAHVVTTKKQRESIVRTAELLFHDGNPKKADALLLLDKIWDVCDGDVPDSFVRLVATLRNPIP